MELSIALTKAYQVQNDKIHTYFIHDLPILVVDSRNLTHYSF